MIHRFDNDRFGMAWAVDETTRDPMFVRGGAGSVLDALDEVEALGGPRTKAGGCLARWRDRLLNRLLWRQHQFNETVVRQLRELAVDSLAVRMDGGNAKPRILLVVPYDVARPRHGGAARLHGLGRALSRQFRVTMVTVVPPTQHRGCFRVWPDFDVACFPLVGEVARRIEESRGRFGDAAPLLALVEHGRHVPGLPEYLSSLRGQIAAMIVDCPHLHPLVAETLPGVPFLYSMPDVNEDFLVRLGGARHADAIRAALVEAETKALRSAAGVVCVSDEDRDRMCERRGLAPGQCILVRNGIDVERAGFVPPSMAARIRSARGIEKNVAVFIGAELQANVDAARFIAKDLAAAVPDCLFLVVGLPGRLVGGELRENVVFAGKIPDRHKEAAFALADVAISPLVHGSGSSLKIPDFVAHGKPVISTAVGARGFPQLAPHVRISDPGAFAASVADVLQRLRRDPAALDADAAAARALVEKDLDWNVIAAPLAEALQRLGPAAQR